LTTVFSTAAAEGGIATYRQEKNPSLKPLFEMLSLPQFFCSQASIDVSGSRHLLAYLIDSSLTGGT